MNPVVALSLASFAVIASVFALYYFWRSLNAWLTSAEEAPPSQAPISESDEVLQNWIDQAHELKFDYDEGKLSKEDFETTNQVIKNEIARLMKERDIELAPYREQAKKLIEQALLAIAIMVGAHSAQAQDSKALERFFGESESLVNVAEDSKAPAGEVRVTVLSPTGKSQAMQEVRIGSLGKSGERQDYFCTTDEKGNCSIQDLPTGDQQAFRLTAIFEEAKYASTPFRLSASQGMQASIQLRPAMQDPRFVLQAFGALFFEYENNNARVLQHVELVNMSDAVFVFPGAGLAFDLPPNADKFETEPGMNQISAVKLGDRVVLTGSMAPGRVALDWQFEIPRNALSSATFTFPFVTLEYDVATDYARGVELNVHDFPPAATEQREDRVVLASRRWTHPGAAEAYDIHLQISGLSAHAPLRWTLFAIAAVILLLGSFFFSRRPVASTTQDVVTAQRSLISQAQELHRQKIQGEVGVEFFQSELTRLTDALAALLRTQQNAQK